VLDADGADLDLMDVVVFENDPVIFLGLRVDHFAEI